MVSPRQLGPRHTQKVRNDHSIKLMSRFQSCTPTAVMKTDLGRSINEQYTIGIDCARKNNRTLIGRMLLNKHAYLIAFTLLASLLVLSLTTTDAPVSAQGGFPIRMPIVRMRLVAKSRRSFQCKAQRPFTWASFGKNLRHQRYCSTPDSLSTYQMTFQIRPS